MTNRRMKLSFFVFAAVIFFLSSCARPSPDGENQTFVSKEEIRIVYLVREGLAYVQAGRFVDAEFKLRQALYLSPNTDHILFNLGVVLDKEGIFDESEAIFRKLLASEPKSIRYREALAHTLSSKMQFKESERLLKEALEIAYDKNERSMAGNIARSLSNLAFRVGDEQGAWCYSQTAYTLLGSSDDLVSYSRLLVALNRYSAAEKALGAWLSLQKAGSVKEPRVYLELAHAYFGEGRYKDVPRAVGLALDLSPLAPKVKFELSVLSRMNSKIIGIKDEMALKDDDETDILKDIWDNPVLVYWPFSLLAKVEEETALKEAKEELPR